NEGTLLVASKAGRKVLPNGSVVTETLTKTVQQKDRPIVSRRRSTVINMKTAKLIALRRAEVEGHKLGYIGARRGSDLSDERVEINPSSAEQIIGWALYLLRNSRSLLDNRKRNLGTLPQTIKVPPLSRVTYEK